MMRFQFFILAVIGLTCFVGCEERKPDSSTNDSAIQEKPNPGQDDGMVANLKETRSFQFHYGAKITGLPKDARVRVWIPIATTNTHQDIERKSTETPVELSIEKDKKYGNQIGYFESSGNESIEFGIDYDVLRKKASLDDAQKSLTADQSQPFLSANKLVPTTGRPAELLADKTIPKAPDEAAELLYEVVENHMKYDKSKPGYGQGDSIWACDSKTGNCTDFHSLFISLARNQNIPAKFEIGFPIGADKKGKVGGYHCWAWFHVADQGWLPVDISEADKHPEMKTFYFGNLTADRLAFSFGRDIELVPAAKGEPLNYFVYPYVEVDGKPLPKDKIELDFHYQPRD